MRMERRGGRSPASGEEGAGIRETWATRGELEEKRNAGERERRGEQKEGHGVVDCSKR